MQNVGQQFGQGGAPTHQGASYGHAESSQTTTGSITSSLRQFRKKDVDKQQATDNGTTVAESHVARVAPHNHYPPRPQDCYRYPTQFPEYGLPPQVKYSEISDHQPLQEQMPPSVIQKVKGKDYMEMCNVPQPHMNHINPQQAYGGDPTLHPHAQYLQKDPQVHPSYKPESQYYPKEAQYQQLPPQMQKYNVPPQIRKYPTENDFLSKLRRIHPTMARSIMSEHHLQESQSSYQPIDQNRMYQNQRYVNYQNNPYPHGYMPPQPYPNYPPSCSYTRSAQMPPRFPSTNPHERSISPRRGYDGLAIPPINYTAMPQRISPNYPQYNAPEYAQHYQHRRGPVAPQEFYQQPCRTAQYMPHQIPQQELAENRVTVSDSIKQYIENWADEETASEMNQIETNRLCKENLRGRDEQSTETVYMINASELQYLENGIPLVASENGIPLVTSENGQYFLKSGVTIDNSTGMVRIVEKPTQEPSDGTADRVVNLHIVDPLKPDCMLANKPNETNQAEKARVVIHQNTVIQKPITDGQYQTKVGTSLPMLVENVASPVEKLTETVFKDSKKETVDKNCSPINMDQIEDGDDLPQSPSEICPLKLLEEPRTEDGNSNDTKLKNMPIIDLLSEEVKVEDETIGENGTERDTVCSEDEKKLESSSEKLEVEPEVMDEDTTCNDISKNENEEARTIPSSIEITEKSDDSEKKVEVAIDKSDDVKEPNEETKETEKIVNEEQISDTFEEVFKTDDSESKDEAINTADIHDTIVAKNEEDTENTAKETNTVEENPSVIVSGQTASKEMNDEHQTDVASDPTSPEKKLALFSDVVFSEKTTCKSTTRRAKRIFSVDDIINNIGSNANKFKPDTKLMERRRSLQITREFLEKEIDASHIFPQKPVVSNESLTNTSEETKEEVEMSETETVNEEIVNKAEEMFTEESKQIENVITDESDTNINEDIVNIKEIDKVEVENVITKEMNIIVEEERMPVKSEELEEFDKHETKEIETVNDIIETSNKKQIDSEENKVEMEKITENEGVESVADTSKNKEENTTETSDLNDETKLSICDDSIINNVFEEQEITTNRTVSSDNTTSVDTSSEIPPDIKDPDVDTSSQNEVQYRNAIRVDENNVLLEIAGELVEISVNIINGKKVITVLPLSESTVVDFNDNYEPLDTTQSHEPIKTNANDDVYNMEASQLFSTDEVPPEPDVIETTSEIIIGLDISLEEEIQLDLEKPQMLTTKAAKKSYENDLQIPSITTSDDITDNAKAASYSPNDKVSSSKEQRPEKTKNVRKKSGKEVRKSSASKKKPKETESVVKELMKIRKAKKETPRQGKEEDEFVPFKDLIKARKLKKMKLQQIRTDENVSADSTNRLDQEESNESESKPEACGNSKNDAIDVDTKDKESSQENTAGLTRDDPVEHIEEPKSKTKDKQPESKVQSSPKIEDTRKIAKDETKSETVEKAIKKVTFGSVTYTESETKTCKLEDPRLKSRTNNGILVPSVSELLKESDRLTNNKKKLSLAEYNNRKRKLASNRSPDENDAKIKKPNPEKTPLDYTVVKSKIDVKQPMSRLKISRPKSLDDIKLFGKPKDCSLMKRKFSLEVTSSKPNHFDWEETQSPKTNTTSQEDPHKRLNEFRGLINNNRSKMVVDVSDLKPPVSEGSEDEILQNYKDQVDSKLSTLNLQIPRTVKPPTNIVNPFSNAETVTLMQRFLRNEKLTGEEMEKIRKIISYKRLMQQLDRIKSPGLGSLNPSYEIRKSCTEKEMKLHLKKVPDQKKRFRNLHRESSSDSDSEFSDTKGSNGDYSVVQSNTYAAGVPKLIIKRKTELPVPVVRLERLNLKLLTNRKRKFC